MNELAEAAVLSAVQGMKLHVRQLLPGWEDSPSGWRNAQDSEESNLVHLPQLLRPQVATSSSPSGSGFVLGSYSPKRWLKFLLWPL